MKYETRNIQTQYNTDGRGVKTFELWEKRGNHYIFAGQFSAPARTANKRLLEYWTEEQDTKACFPRGEN